MQLQPRCLNSVAVPCPWTHAAPNEQTKADPGAVGVPQLIFGNKLPTHSTRWEHSTWISFSPCLLQAHLSNYILLPQNFSVDCIQQEITFSCRKKKNQIVGPYFIFPHLHLAIVLCTAHTSACSVSGECWMPGQPI